MDARRGIAVAVFASSAALGGALLVMERRGMYTEGLVRDVTAAADLPAWTGMLSTFGLLVWAAAIGICLLAGVALLRAVDGRAPFFLATAALLGLLTLDDAYLLHERVLPENFGIPELATYALLGLAALTWAGYFRRELMRSDRRLLVAAGAAFAASLLVDFTGDEAIVLEDWLKLSGIMAFCGWCFGEALTAVEGRVATRRGTPVPEEDVPRRPHLTVAPELADDGAVAPSRPAAAGAPGRSLSQ